MQRVRGVYILSAGDKNHLVFVNRRNSVAGFVVFGWNNDAAAWYCELDSFVKSQEFELRLFAVFDDE